MTLSFDRPRARQVFVARRVALAAAISLCVACGGGDAGDSEPTGPTPDVPDPALPSTYVSTGRAAAGDVFVHLFEWRWVDVARECEAWLGPKGFKAVQVSPPNEHAVVNAGGTSFPWWQRYQPVSYRLDNSRSGTAAEFASMVQRCKAVGVDIYVDAVINHMTAGSGTGSAGSRYTKYDYPDVPWTAADFHPACPIESYNVPNQVQRCELVGLSDLKTESETVRDRIAAYLTAMTQLGVAGFRIDAAKHIPPRDLDAIVSRVNAAAAAASRPRPYVFLELINNPNEAILPQQHYGVGFASGGASDLTEFIYGYRVTDAFSGRNGATLASVLPTLSASLLPSDKSVVFVDNHDNQRGANLYYGAANYEQAVVFMLAYPHGYPSVMSSYAFNRGTPDGRDAGPPSDGGGVTRSAFTSGGASACATSLGDALANTWVCEHRRRAIANMVAFRKAAASTPVSSCGRPDWTIGGDANRIAFCRDGAGFVALSRSATASTETLPTRLAAGRYCNIARDEFTPAAGNAAASCSGAPIEVLTDGTAVVPLPASGMVALHVRARLP